MKNKMKNIMIQTQHKVMGKGHANLGLFLVVFLVFLFGISSMIYVDSYTKTLEEQRKSTYGSWHIAIYDTTQEVYETICNHGIVETAGYMEVYGYAVEETSHIESSDEETSYIESFDEEISILGSVGYADDALIEVGNITLLDGAFPSAESEIAVEASMLDQMGYSYELGQEIIFSISTRDNSGEYVTDEVSFTLCGVVKNYSAYWKTDGYWMASYFVAEEYLDENGNTMLYTFAELESQYAGNADDLSVLTNADGYFVKNEFTYLQYSEGQEETFDLMIQQTVIVLASCLFMMIFMNMELKQRYNSFVMIRTLGATKTQIVALFVRGKLRILCVGSVLGIILGFMFPYILFEKIGDAIGGIAICYIDMKNIVVMILILYLSGIISVVFSMIRLFQIPLRGMAQQQKVVKKKYKCRKELCMNHLFSAFLRADCKQKIFGIILTCVASFLIYLLAYQTWDTYSLYAQYCENYPADYTFGLLAGTAPPRNTMTESELEEIKLAYGVEEVQAIAMSEYYGITFESDYNQEYANAIQEELSDYMLANGLELPDASLCGTLIGVSDNLISLYTNEIDSSGTVVDELADGEIILYLPIYTKDENGTLLSNLDAWQSSDESQILSEGTITSGDTVQIQTDVTTEALNVVGIIETFDDVPFSYNPMRSYSLICNENTYRKLTGSLEYAYVLVYQDGTTIPYQTDVELSKIQTSLYFNNNRVVSSEQLQNVILQMILALLLCTFAILMMTVIRFGISAMYEKQKIERYQLLYKLGMSKSVMLKNSIWNTVSESFIGCFLAVVTFLILRFIQEEQELCDFADYIKPEWMEYLQDIWTRFVHLTNWGFLVILVLGVYIFNLIIMIIHDYRFIYKENRLM